MKFFPKLLIAVSVLLFIQITGVAQTTAPKLKGWQLLNYKEDGYMGTGVKEAYDLLKGRKSQTVIIAVIDSGVDTLQEDLKAALWVNPREIPGNGKDDDGNGYTDDIHGWNFCGSSSGENLSNNTHEIERVYHKWKNEFEGISEKKIPADRKFLYSQWKRAESLINKDYEEYQQNIKNIENASLLFKSSNTILTSYLKKTDFIKTDLAAVNGSDSMNWAVRLWKSVFDRGSDPEIKNTDIIRDLEAYHNTLLNNRKRKEDLPVDFRGALTKDNYENIHDSIYGNNNLKSSSGNHGTHVSGIIGAIRNNNIGMDGIVDNVRIMVIRAVPGGDEHDKDVALAIRYAVNNGASIINMSFGKPVSPYKQLVDDAIAYAASKNVLLVHGSGNDGQDIDENSFYPSPFMLDGTKASNMLTVGASGDYSLDGLVAGFSNYGIKTVDLFAPGMYINSTIPNNNYEPADGTSMASPVAAGVAGLLKSYFPALTPVQMIDLLMRSGTSITDSVTLPGTDKKTTLNKLCKSGKIINAYEAVKLALQQYAY
ncbi:MAG: peptidase S8 and S53 subtilisin kexin sedolisin [Chitinophagaceae bacterium]|nr:MAG: peptidase S8 and S53 subtilisin kexin sedolisin [Chitinophagaceae bacterium]